MDDALRFLVLGSSNSSGTGLADTKNAWPWLVSAELGESLGRRVEIEHTNIFPVGPRAVPLAMGAVEAFNPDLVVYSFGAFPCAVATVSTRVRRRYGDRVHRQYQRVERYFERRTANRDGGNARLNRWGRWLVRHTIGVETISSFDELVAIETEIVHQLSQHEGVDAVIFGEPCPGSSIVRDNPRICEVLAAVRAKVEEAGRSHHFLVADCNEGFDTYPDRDRLFHSDGIHKTVLAHRIQADAIMKTLLSAPSPFAPKGEGTRVNVGRQ